MLALNDAQRLALLNTVFPPRMGQILEMSPLKAFPLGLNAHKRLVDDGVVARIGNAADGSVSPDGSVMGTYLHGLFEDPAALHALFGALQKGRHDPWLSRAVIDGCYCVIAIPFALFAVPWPEARMWPIFAGAWLIHSQLRLELDERSQRYQINPIS